MSDRIQVDGEALSALMDSELSEFELRRLLARVSEDPELLATWERYNLARAVFQPEPLNLKLTAGDALSSRVMAAVAAEPAFETVGSPPKSQAAESISAPAWTTQFARIAIAASVALAVFVGMQSVLNTPDTPAIAGQDAQQSGPATDAATVQIAVDADAQQRLNEYIRSVSIPGRAEPSEGPFNILRESPMLHPVSDLELVQEVERAAP